MIARLVALLIAALPAAALAQEVSAVPPTPATNQPIYDMVAADRETAWRINRVTGEVMICRVDTTAGLDSVRARCAPAATGGPPAGGAQTSLNPEDQAQ